MKVLVMAHGHPVFSAGGGERAAHALFKHLERSDSKISKAFFAATGRPEHIGHDADFGLFRGYRNEIIMNLGHVDNLTYQNKNYDLLVRRVKDLIDYARPDIVNLHHFVNSGLEIIEILHDLGVRVVLTLHEYLVICHHFGQMIKTNHNLCYFASPVECSHCFPQISPGQFFIREKMIKHYMASCEALVSPSEFLRNRFLNWGVDDRAIFMIENPIDPDLLAEEIKFRALPYNVSAENELPIIRIGYFGQLNPFKGIEILLQAIKMLPQNIRKLVHVGIHGANLNIQTAEFIEKINELMNDNSDCIHNYGPYDNSTVTALMRGYDRIVVPSTWWENSPVVIQEAKLAGVPILGARIGGVAEKCTGENDILFEPRSPASLANAICQMVGRPKAPDTALDYIISETNNAVKSYINLFESIL